MWGKSKALRLDAAWRVWGADRGWRLEREDRWEGRWETRPERHGGPGSRWASLAGHGWAARFILSAVGSRCRLVRGVTRPALCLKRLGCRWVGNVLPWGENGAKEASCGLGCGDAGERHRRIRNFLGVERA